VRHKVPLPLYDEILRIPLYIKFPLKQITGTKKQFITLADLYPTILSACSLAVPEEISSKPFGEISKPVVAEFFNYDTGAQRALYKENYKLIQYEKGREAELYDLETDSLETNNIAKVLPETTANMENMLTEWVKNHPPRYQAADIQKEEVSPNVKEDLKALGYIQ
jgi:arylsulfatase A-like enzyme